MRLNEMDPRFPDVTVQLSGTDGNAFAVAALELAAHCCARDVELRELATL